MSNDTDRSKETEVSSLVLQSQCRHSFIPIYSLSAGICNITGVFGIQIELETNLNHSKYLHTCFCKYVDESLCVGS